MVKRYLSELFFYNFQFGVYGFAFYIIIVMKSFNIHRFFLQLQLLLFAQRKKKCLIKSSKFFRYNSNNALVLRSVTRDA